MSKIHIFLRRVAFSNFVGFFRQKKTYFGAYSYLTLEYVVDRQTGRVYQYRSTANQANHTIDWKKTMVTDREQDRPTKWIKEAVHIRKEGHRAMNRDEGSYQLSHAYDRLLDATADRRIKTRKN